MYLSPEPKQAPGSDMEYLLPSKITGFLRYTMSTEPISSGGDTANIPRYLFFSPQPWLDQYRQFLCLQLLPSPEGFNITFIFCQHRHIYYTLS